MKKCNKIKKPFKQLRKSVLWKSANGSVYVKDMEVSHIQNTVIWLLRNKEWCSKYSLGPFSTDGMGADGWVKLFRTELKYREFLESKIVPNKPAVKRAKTRRDKPILDDAQYNNFFRILSEIVHAEGRADKKAALLNQINREEDRRNLELFNSWFYNRCNND